MPYGDEYDYTVKQRALADVHLRCRGSIQVLLTFWLIMTVQDNWERHPLIVDT